MIDLGTVRPGSTIRIPFNTFDKDDGSAITMTNFAAADILIYKDGNTTARASTSGFTATTDFNSKTGKQLAVIDLADNTTADFYAAGSEYLVAIDQVTVDSVTVGGWVARFRIGYPDAILDTTIATLSSQTSFTLTVGPAEDSALLGRQVVIHDAASAVQLAYGVISAYTGSTKTVTLIAAPTFTIAAKDNISVLMAMPLQPTTFGRALDVSSGGEAGVDWANVGSPTTSLNLSGTTISTSQVAASVTGNVGGNVTGSVGSVVGAVGSVTGNVGGNVTGSVGSLATQAKADVNTEVDTAIADARLDELLNADSDIDGAQPPTVGSVFHELMSKTAGSFTFDQTTDSNEALRDRGDAAWTTATGFSTHTAADVWAVVARTLTAATNITSTGGTTVPQTGDSYAIVNSVTHGNAALKTLIDTIDDLLDTEIAAIKAETDKIDATIPDSVPADGTRPTPRQALYMIVQFLLERAVSGTTLTVKKVDGSTSLMTCTLNDSTSPTSITRAT